MDLFIQQSSPSHRESILTINGEIDVYTAPELRDKLLPLCEQEKHKVTVNLSGVTYMDSTGLGVFIGAYKASQSAGGALSLTGLSPRVTRLFEITGLNELMTIENSLREDGQ